MISGAKMKVDGPSASSPAATESPPITTRATYGAGTPAKVSPFDRESHGKLLAREVGHRQDFRQIINERRSMEATDDEVAGIVDALKPADQPNELYDLLSPDLRAGVTRQEFVDLAFNLRTAMMNKLS
ncbi:MAG: hypothetical protein HY465_03885 [Deltaproteobacteria bacterium]|nr:hypothetical protein [Deltaproteobacteria bacterium]